MVPSGLSSIFRAFFTGRIFSLHCNNNKKKIIDETKLQVHHFSCLFRIGKSQLFHTLELFIRLTLVNFFFAASFISKMYIYRTWTIQKISLNQNPKNVMLQVRQQLLWRHVWECEPPNISRSEQTIYQSREYVAYTHRFKSGLFHVI